MSVLTTKLANGREVLARELKGYGPYPMTYANYTQAAKAVAKLGPGWSVRRFLGRPFYATKDVE